jgi:hypothetical protein
VNEVWQQLAIGSCYMVYAVLVVDRAVGGSKWEEVDWLHCADGRIV